MFNLFNKKQTLLAPADGRLIPLSQVADPVFSQKILGDGVAIDELNSDTICSPADGVLEMIFRTNHAFAVKTSEGIDVLVHIGINTVELEGKGFERLREQGQSVKAGDPVIRIDRQQILQAGYSLTTPVIFTSTDTIKELAIEEKSTVITGKDAILTYKKR
ncbi:MAG TPA: PTS glucose transporter subunit IIA [Patescibacteria group bacterium]|nr:PTS glucose transporter subunit IIA [Patescibacteria group bacterium]